MAKNLDIDDPRYTVLRKQIIKGKPFLKKNYDEWYKGIANELSNLKTSIFEIGSGVGYLSDHLKNYHFRCCCLS